MKKFLRYCCISLFAVSAQAEIIHGVDTSSPPQPVPYTSTSGQITITTLAGEDTTNGVMKVEHQYAYTTCNNVTGDAVCKASAGFLHSVTCGSDAAATAGSLAIRDATSAGTGTILFTWTFSTTEIQPRTIIFDTVMATGIVLDFTTTADVTCQASYR